MPPTPTTALPMLLLRSTYIVLHREAHGLDVAAELRAAVADVHLAREREDVEPEHRARRREVHLHLRPPEKAQSKHGCGLRSSPPPRRPGGEDGRTLATSTMKLTA